MPHSAITNQINRTSRRHDRQGGYDIADIYEARLLAQGIRADDFTASRSTAERPSPPTLAPIRFGRSADASPIPAIAPVEPDDTPDPA